MIACSSPVNVPLHPSCHRCNCHLQSLAWSARCNIPVGLLNHPPPRTRFIVWLFVHLRGLQQRSQAGKETLEKLGNLWVSLDFYLFPLPSRISINRNFPLLSKNCVINAAEDAASLMSLGRRQTHSWGSSHSFLSRSGRGVAACRAPLQRRESSGFIVAPRSEDPWRSTCLPQEGAQR